MGCDATRATEMHPHAWGCSHPAQPASPTAPPERAHLHQRDAAKGAGAQLGHMLQVLQLQLLRQPGWEGYVVQLWYSYVGLEWVEVGAKHAEHAQSVQAPAVLPC